MYHHHGVTLSKAQCKILAKGGKIKLLHKNLSGKHPVHLTHTQMNKLSRCHKAGKGSMLHFSAKQAKHNIKKGGGFWDTISSIASNPIVQKIGSFAVDQGIKRLGGKVGRKRKSKSGKKGKGFFSTLSNIASNPIVQRIGSFAVDQGIKRLGGKAGRKRKSRSGSKTKKKHMCGKCSKLEGASFRL
jgi:hypothetical protein